MKNRLSILILLLSITLLTTIKLSAQDKNSALEYNDKMIAIQTSVDDALAKFVDALDAFDPDLMAKEKKNALQTIKKANKDIAAMGKFDGKDDYIKEMKIFMKMYKEITSKDLSEIMNLIIKKGEDFSETDWDTYDSYFESALNKYDSAFDRFNKFQSDFASKWGFTIQNNEEDYYEEENYDE